jgi:hypothetical protein
LDAGTAHGRLGFTPPDKAARDLDANEGHVETGDATEVGDVLSFGRYWNRQPTGVDASDDHGQRVIE